MTSPTADPEALTKAFYKARAAGDEDASTAIFHGIRQSGATLRGPTQEELAAYGKNGANGLGSNLENSLAGAGKSFYDNARGIAQAAVGGAKLVTMPTQVIEKAVGNKSVVTDALDAVSNKYDQLKTDQSQVNQQDAPLMNTKAGITGNIIG